jgi:hypothetical protein
LTPNFLLPVEHDNDARKDHQFIFVKNISSERTTSIYKCSKCGLECYCNNYYCGGWEYYDKYSNANTFELELLSCEEIMIKGIIE